MFFCIHWGDQKILELPGGSAQARGNDDSANKQHVEMIGHDIHPNYVEIIERGMSSQQKHLFLESLQSTLNTGAVNEPQPFPKAYLSSIVSLRDREKL